MATEGPVRLIVCDDHRVLTDALVMVLAQDPELELAAPPVGDPEEAIQLCREHMPDVVLMDISFPGPLNGIEATRRIKELSPGTSVVIMTAHHDDGLILDAAQAGASGFVSKTEGVDAVLVAAKRAARGDVLFDAAILARSLSTASRAQEERGRVEALLDRLTPRELEVLRSVADGLPTKEIAEHLFISAATAQKHITHLLRKLEVRSKAEAVAFAHRAGVAQSPGGGTSGPGEAVPKNKT